MKLGLLVILLLLSFGDVAAGVHNTVSAVAAEYSCHSYIAYQPVEEASKLHCVSFESAQPPHFDVCLVVEPACSVPVERYYWNLPPLGRMQSLVVCSFVTVAGLGFIAGLLTFRGVVNNE